MSLLLDALDRILTDPVSPGRWHALMAAWRDSGDRAARQSTLQRVESLVQPDPRADALRLSFLAGATGDSRFEFAAAERLLQIAPLDPDRLAASMSFQWLSALQYIERREDFVAALVAGRLPEMAALQARAAERLLPADFVPRIPQQIDRIAVIAPYIGHQFHTPSQMAISQCRVLAREGRTVQIFSAQELLPPDSHMFRGDGRDLVLPPLDAQAWRRRLPAGVTMTLADTRYGMSGRWRNLLPAVAAFDPDAILLVGLYSPMAAALYARRPVVGLSVNTVPPIAPADVWLAAEPQPRWQAPWGSSIPAPRAIYHPYRITRPRHRKALTRADLELPDTALVLVAAGFRLEHEIKRDWADRMLQAFARQPSLMLLLVGGPGRIPAALSRMPQERLRVLPTRDDLPEILRLCDIYLNPPRMGGGISVAEAMAEGLPVVSLSGCDGGDKVGDDAVSDLDAYIERLLALIGDPQRRRDAGARLRARFDNLFDLEASGPALLEACRSAATLADARLTAAS